MFMNVSQTTKDIVREFDPKFVELCNCELHEAIHVQAAQEQLDAACRRLEELGIPISQIYPLIASVAPGFELQERSRLVFRSHDRGRSCASLKYVLLMIEPWLMFRELTPA